jgi:hypothetical protein
MAIRSLASLEQLPTDVSSVSERKVSNDMAGPRNRELALALACAATTRAYTPARKTAAGALAGAGFCSGTRQPEHVSQATALDLQTVRLTVVPRLQAGCPRFIKQTQNEWRVSELPSSWVLGGAAQAAPPLRDTNGGRGRRGGGSLRETFEASRSVEKIQRAKVQIRDICAGTWSA